jgi:hypothetical protein
VDWVTELFGACPLLGGVGVAEGECSFTAKADYDASQPKTESPAFSPTAVRRKTSTTRSTPSSA